MTPTPKTRPSGPRTLTLTLEDGQRLSLAQGTRAALWPQPDASALLIVEWGTPERTLYRVPAGLLASLAPHFPPVRP